MASFNFSEALRKVKPGDNIYKVVTAARINAIADALQTLIAGDNLNAGDGIRINKGGSFGVVISRKKSDSESELEKRIETIENRLNNFKVVVTCNADGTFTITSVQT